MITIHEAGATDFSTLGLGALSPTECLIEENAGGLYELTLTQPIADDMKYTLIAQGRILNVPAPMRETPLAEIGQSGTVTRRIYKVTTDGRRLNMRTAADQSARVIRAYRPGTEVIVTGTEGSWSSVIIADGGASGWMWTANLTFVREESESISGDTPGAVIQPRQTREQLFRICEAETDSERRAVTVRAQHISYDLKGTIVAREYAPEAVSAQSVCAVMMSYADHETPFRIICTVTDPITLDCTGRSLLDIIMDPDSGILAQTGARLIRDNYDLFILPGEERERGVSLNYGKNLLSACLRTDTSRLITRIQPAGRTKDGETLLIDDDPAQSFIDSARIGQYPAIYAKRVEYDVVEGKDLSKDEARKALREKAQADFDAGCDLPDVRLDTEFVRLDLAEDYKNLANAYALHLYDVVPVTDEDAGIAARARMTGYKYDALLDRYDSTTLGELTDADVTVYGYELAAGSVSGTKIIPGSISGDRLRNLAVSYAKISRAAIAQLSADSLTAVRAEINRLAAGEITTDQLYADLAKIAAAQITAANIDKANINWADIKSLTTEIADIANASIGTAKIDWAKIYDLTTDTAIITEGEAGKLYIARLNVTEANMVNLTVGELMLKAADGSFKRLTVDADGNVSAETVTVEGGNIANATISGGKLIENTITARELNVESIFADTALIRAIKAANIDVSDLFAASATVSALDAYIVKASTITALKGQLDLWASDKITAAVGGKLTPEGVSIGTNVEMDDDHFRVSTSNFDVDVPGDAGDLHIDENGLSADTATFNTLNCNEVVKKYTGASTITLAANSDASVVGAALNNKCVASNVSILLNGDINGLLDIRGTTGNGNITINGQGHTLNGHVWIVNNAKYITIQNLKVSNSGDQRGSMHFHANRAIRVSKCTFNGNNLSTSAGSSQGLRVYHTSIQVENCEFYNMADFNMVFGSCADVYVTGCKGDGVKCIYTDGASVKWSGTRPSGSWNKGVPSLTTPADLTTLTINTGSATPAETPVTTASFKANATGTYYPSGHWINDNVIRQGHEGTGSSARRDYGCMWFAASSLKNKTIKSATLTIKRVAGKGRSSSVTMKLWTTTVTGKSGVMASSTLTSLGEVGKIANGETLTVSVPVSAIATIASGGGLVLYTEETANASGKTYSANYAHFDGTNGSAPVLTVNYQ